MEWIKEEDKLPNTIADCKDFFDLGLYYHRETERYDRNICSVKNERGMAIPTNGDEMRLISSNARRVFKDICSRLGIDGHELRKAIKSTTQQFEKRIEKESTSV